MSTLLITRHRGAREWTAQQGVTVDYVFGHMNLDFIRPGDVVIGTLPVHLAAEVCKRGGRYWHLSLETPPARRGGELSADDMRIFGARLEEYTIQRIPAKDCS